MNAAVAPLRTIGLRAAGASDPGRVRHGNEDRLFADAERGIFLVVDGVGGRAAGEVASAIATEVITDSLAGLPGTPEQRVRAAIALANNAIHREAQGSQAHSGMTCVLTLALLAGQRLTIGHVGDTRLYKLTPGGISKVTRDHSPVGELEENGEISEEDAMRHTRRHEVFRDVGSAPHRPDDPEFIEIFETAFEDDSAILLCSDGLSDMLPSTSIDGIVRRHAGDPAAAVEALIGAANVAGGRDNITAVCVEGPAFAAASAGTVEAPPEHAPGGVIRNRFTWFAAGAVSGIAGALALVVALDLLPGSWRSRTLVVGGTSSGYPSIGEAMAAAGPRDIVEVEPGSYLEQVVMGDGVDLKASVPGSVTLAAPPGRAGWVSLTSHGSRGSTVSGLRILGTPEAPIAVGLKLDGADTSVDDVTVEGNIDVGIDVQNDGVVVLRASRFHEIQGLPLRIGGAARPTVRQNLFVGGADERGPAVQVQGDAQPTLVGNLFVGYAEAIGAPPPQREQLIRGNYLIRAPGHPVEQHPR